MPPSVHNVYPATFADLTECQPLTSLASRFWPKVRKGPNCWLWTGAVNQTSGYGQMRDGHRGSVPQYAHRIAYRLLRGAIPDGLSVLHSCDTPRCVNPDHLFLGTHTDNMRDASRKGRLSVGRPSGRKVSDADIAAMFTLRAQGWKLARIADRFSVSKAYVSLVLNAKRRALPITERRTA